MTLFDNIDVNYLINKWAFWKGIAVGSTVTLIILAIVGLLDK